MLIPLSFPRIFQYSFARFLDLFDGLLFLYFSTLHADQLNLVLGPYTLRLNTLLAFLLLVLLGIKYRRNLFHCNRQLLWGIGGIFLSILLSFCFTPFKSRCFFFIGWYGLTVVCYLLLPYYLIYSRDHVKILRLYLCSFFLVGVCALIQWILSLLGLSPPFATQMIRETFVRPNAFSYEPSYYALYMTPCMVMVQLLYLFQKNHPFSFIHISKKTLWSTHFFYLLSTATSTLFAYVLFLLTLGVVLAMTHWRKEGLFSSKILGKMTLVFASSLLFLFLAFPFVAKHYYLKFFIKDFHLHHSFAERWIGISNTWNIFKEFPWVGIGLGGIPTYLFEAWASGNPFYSFLFQEETVTETTRILKVFEPTNVFMEIVGSLGVIGLFAFAYLGGTYFFLVNQARKILPQNSEAKKWIFIFFISVLVMLMVLQFNQGILRPYIWVHFALAFGFTEKMLYLH